jgi:hypothetical protein
MSLSPSVAEVLSDHVTLELESIDRVHMNLYVPQLQHEHGVVHYLRDHLGYPFASTALMAPITRRFVASITAFAEDGGVPLVAFQRGQRKDDVAHEHLKSFDSDEGVVFIGKAQEKASVFRTQSRRNPVTGARYPWIYRSSAVPNSYYFYCVDNDFGPFFLRYCSYFPYTARLNFNAHEWLKRQLDKRAIAYEALDNGIAWCEDPALMQRLADSLSASKIEIFARKWLRRLPTPYDRADRAAGYHYDISILQAEFALTQVLDRPLSGRVFFEEVIRENLDLGRPDKVQLIFNRRVTKRTPSRFRTRVITDGVIPSLHIDYKHSKCKQYLKEGRALRTETVINDARDFAVGKRLHNLPALREIGFQANRRLLSAQKTSHDCFIGEDMFARIASSITVDGQRASALRFGDQRVLALFAVLVSLCHLPCGFHNKDMRGLLAALLGIDPALMTQGKMTYDLRRLRLHGIIERIEGTHRYQLTDFGLRAALFFTRTYARLLRPGLAQIMPRAPASPSKLRAQLDKVRATIDTLTEEANLAA